MELSSKDRKNDSRRTPRISRCDNLFRQFHIEVQATFQGVTQEGQKWIYLDCMCRPTPWDSSWLTMWIMDCPPGKDTALMKDVHGVDISHQSILNYWEHVALLLKPYVDHYPYEISDQFCGDETYIRVGGRWRYLFFFFDAVKRSFSGLSVSRNRDSQAAILAIDEVLTKFTEVPEDLTIVVDGNPIYLLAQQFFAQHGISFDIKQVIGLTNEDPVSAEYRPLKNRSSNGWTGPSKATIVKRTGFGSEQGSVSYVTLFVAYFNFLLPHSALEGKVPVLPTRVASTA